MNSGIPLWALILDGLGTALVAVGLFLEFAGADALSAIPDGLAAMRYGVIALGVVLMGPLLVTLVRRAAGR